MHIVTDQCLPYRRHVYADLRAYLCTSEACGMTMFEDKRAWIDHEMEKHWRSWSCYLCKFTSDQQSDVRSHLERSHPEILSEEGEHAMIYITSRPLAYIDTSRCTLCDWDNVLTSEGSATMVSRASFMGHLAHHLEQMALFAVPRANPGENSGGIKSNHAANCGSQASQSAEDSSLAGDESSIESATRADKKQPSAPTHQTLDNQAATFITISQAFPSQSQDRDATFAWMTRTEPHDLEHVTDRDEAFGFSAYDPHDEIRKIAEQLSEISAKVADIHDHPVPMAKYASIASQELEETIKGISAQMNTLQIRIVRTFHGRLSHALINCVVIMEDLRPLVISLGICVFIEQTERTSKAIIERVSDALNLLAAALEKDMARRRVHGDSPQDQFDETPTPDEVTPVATDPRVAVPVVKTTSYMASDSGEPLETVYTAADTLQSKGDDDLTSPDHQAHMTAPDDWITEARSELTSRLYYPGIFDSQQSIRPPYPDTFDWLWFYNPFAEFLRDGEKLFWISGEPGCGKSTMMRMIECDRRTQECLSSWANGRTLYIFLPQSRGIRTARRHPRTTAIFTLSAPRRDGAARALGYQERNLEPLAS
jgi:hypothetical protein